MIRTLSQFAVNVVLVLSVPAAGSFAQSRNGPPDTARQPASTEDDSDARDERMRELVAAITVSDVPTGSTKPRTAGLMPQPLVRYSDQQRRFPDATLWGWQLDGRPLAISKLERVVTGADDDPGWQYCLVSLSEGLIDVRWQAGDTWRASEHGLTWNALTNAPQPHRSENGRLLQMKGLARQFDAVIVNPLLDQRENMRLLPTPIMRYSSERQHVVDGVIFGFTSKGTNPDTLLLIELQDAGDEPVWNYAVVGMTADAVSVERDGQAVWNKEVTPEPGDHGSWVWRVDLDSDSR